MERYRQIRPAPYDTGKPSPNTRFREQDHAHAIENQTSSENGSSAFRHQGDFLFQTCTEVDVDAKGQSCTSRKVEHCSTSSDERDQAARVPSDLEIRLARDALSRSPSESSTSGGRATSDSSATTSRRAAKNFSSNFEQVQRLPCFHSVPTSARTGFTASGTATSSAASSASPTSTIWEKSPPDACVLRVALLGLPNAGKSSLLNALVGGAAAAVSRKANTTDTDQVSGVVTRGNVQLILQDAPGILPIGNGGRRRLKYKELSRKAWSGYQGADVVLLVVDAVRRPTSEIFGLLRKLGPLPPLPAQQGSTSLPPLPPGSTSRVGKIMKNDESPTSFLNEEEINRPAFGIGSARSSSTSCINVSRPFSIPGEDFLLDAQSMNDQPRGPISSASSPLVYDSSVAVGNPSLAGGGRDDFDLRKIARRKLAAQTDGEFSDSVDVEKEPERTAVRKEDARSFVEEEKEEFLEENPELAHLLPDNFEELLMSTSSSPGERPPLILVLNKIDKQPEFRYVTARRKEFTDRASFRKVFYTSALEGRGIETLARYLVEFADTGGQCATSSSYIVPETSESSRMNNRRVKDHSQFVSGDTPRHLQRSATLSQEEDIFGSTLAGHDRGGENSRFTALSDKNLDASTGHNHSHNRYRRPWLFSPERKSTASQVEQVKQLIRSVLFTWFNKDVPYKIEQETVGWMEHEVVEDAVEQTTEEQSAVEQTQGRGAEDVDPSSETFSTSSTARTSDSESDTHAIEMKRTTLLAHDMSQGEEAMLSSKIQRQQMDDDEKQSGGCNGSTTCPTSGTTPAAAGMKKKVIVIEQQLTVEDSIVARMVCGVGGRLIQRLRENVAYQLERLWSVDKVVLRITVKCKKARLSRRDLLDKAQAARLL
ncbi:unnamed protein product [Amoebophrya sp. A25]|nr:unnamed protein product [Amoebophrya sp. A25]|eukprot:GSA25T00012519001.1